MEILIATNNRHKVVEFARIFEGCRVLSPADIDLDFEFDETGQSFFENSYGKALALHKLTGRRVMADDSGLCVSALGGAPGIYSARYGAPASGENLPSGERNAYLLRQLEGKTDRAAWFVCCMVLVLSEYRFFAAQETLAGTITTAPAGEEGFGYDPVFFVPEAGKTVAQLDAAEKDAISHRGRAARVMQRHLAGLQE